MLEPTRKKLHPLSEQAKLTFTQISRGFAKKRHCCVFESDPSAPCKTSPNHFAKHLLVSSIFGLRFFGCAKGSMPTIKEITMDVEEPSEESSLQVPTPSPEQQVQVRSRALQVRKSSKITCAPPRPKASTGECWCRPECSHCP